ncbi:hypothetical protein P3T40_007296 [Paraburkholderia sp. EB58]|uniref:hypothetical protein n=1 Tax=Paraburkholderia sp. EB58 TaxID=3035125 RepID=UPI003D2482D2
MNAFRMIRLGAIGLALVSRLVCAHELDASLDCHSGPHEFIAQFVAAKEIGSKPTEVSESSVNVYRPQSKRDLTALGFGVQAVFGFSPNDNMFIQKGRGEAPQPVYGVVVMAWQDAVNERIREMGSPATVKEVIPMVMTAVVCQQ